MSATGGIGPALGRTSCPAGLATIRARPDSGNRLGQGGFEFFGRGTLRSRLTPSTSRCEGGSAVGGGTLTSIRIDLNCDVGESFGAWRIDISPAVLEKISSANVACGFHAGDAMAMEEAVCSCRTSNVAVGAHPGFPDLMGFGRREMTVSPREARNYLLYQVGALVAFCRSAGVELQHVKPHGALYNAAAGDARLAEGLIDGMLHLQPRPILLTLSGSCLARLAAEAGLRVGHEIFADRAYNSDGSLVSRCVPGAVIRDPEVIARRAVRMIREGEVETIDAGVIAVRADSICVHGDTPGATEIVLRLADALEQAKIEVVALRDLV
jgi:UPF0271 protein